MHWDLHLWVVEGNEKGWGEVTYMTSIGSDDFTEMQSWSQKHTIFLALSISHTHTHRVGALSTRKETEIGNKDHPLCLRTVNRSSNVFNLSPKSNNGAHSTPPRYCSTVRLKALGFYHPSPSQFLSFCRLCAVHEGINSWNKDSLVKRRRKKTERQNCGEKRKRINRWRGVG